MKTTVQGRENLLLSVTDELGLFFREKPNAVFTMAAGRTMIPLWDCMAKAVEKGKMSLAGTLFFQTAEFLDGPEDRSLRAMTEEFFLKRTDLNPDHCFWMQGKTPEEYEESVRKAGGLDLAVLGIGENAHIGFNEPATPYASRCHIQKLTDRTKTQFAWRFDSAQSVPEYGCTMGIRTLTEARKIIILCLGEEKADAVFQMLYARNDSVVPAAFLQIPFDVKVYADREAAKKLQA